MTPQQLLVAAKTQALLLRIAIAAIEQAQNARGRDFRYPDAEHPEAILVEAAFHDESAEEFGQDGN